MGTKNSAIRRIKYLVLLQAGEKLRPVRKSEKKKAAFKIFLGVIFAVAITFAINFVLGYMKSSFSFKFGYEMFTSVIFATQVISIITCIGNMLNVLYSSKENMILMAFPCKYNEIFISKIIVFSLEEMKKSCFFVLPFLLAYGMTAGAQWYYWVQLPLIWWMMTLLPVLISATLSIPAAYVKKFLENHPLIYAGLYATLLVGVFILVVFVLGKIPKPVNLIAVYNSFMSGVNAAFVKVNKFALFYNFMGQTMFGKAVYMNLPLALVVFAAFGALCFFVAMPFYFKAASSTSEHSRQKAHKHRKEKKGGNLFMTFLKKEFKLMFRTPSSINSAISIILVFPILSYAMNFIVAAIRTNVYGDYMTVAFNIMITLSLLSTYNAQCAMAISSEGSEFSVLKAAPSNTMIATWAKLTVTMVVDIIAVITMCAVLINTTTLKAVDIVMMVIMMLLVSMGNILWSFQLDITNPKVNDYAVKGDAVVDNPNVARALVIGFLISTVIGALTLILLIDDYATGWLRAILIAAAFFVARLYLYNSNLKVYFNDIQG